MHKPSLILPDQIDGQLGLEAGQVLSHLQLLSINGRNYWNAFDSFSTISFIFNFLLKAFASRCIPLHLDSIPRSRYANKM